jgi:hypothetical protein
MRVTIRKAAEITGYTEKAIRAKIERGVWPQGEVWDYAPDNRILVDMGGFERWAEGRGSERSESRSRLTSNTRGSAAGSG